MISLSIPAGDLRVLCLGAHADDIEIGCGGTALTLAATRRVTVHHFLLTGDARRQAEARAALELFWPGSPSELTCAELPDGRLPSLWNEVKQSLEDLAKRFEPDLIFAPRTDDAHQDHRLLAELVTTVWRDHLILRYEIPKWDGDLGRVTHYVGLDHETAERKVDALMTAYVSQETRGWWSRSTFEATMRLRGVESRNPFAEGFEITKSTIHLGEVASTAQRGDQ